MSYPYYWLPIYAKRLKTFFASDIEDALKKDEIYFSMARILVAIEYWINKSCIEVLDTKYVQKFGGNPIKKYIWIKDPDPE